MPFCPQCGIDNSDSARYCDQCGAALVPVPAAKPAAPPSPAVTQPSPAIAQPSSVSLSAGPTTCPQCGSSVIPGEAFCDNCGAPLTGATRPAAAPFTPGVPPQPVYPAPQPSAPAVAPQPVYPAAPPPAPAPAPARAAPAAPRSQLAPARLIVVDTGASLPLPAGTEAVLGRADPVSRYAPDVDMTTHGALDRGVGRKHARLFIQGGQVMLEDLDSTNGTQLNGQRLAPRQPAPVRDGDTIQLGRLVLQFLP